MNILIVDDHRIVLDGIKSILNEEKDINIVGEALNGKECIKLLENIKVDIVLLDVNMPIMDGVVASKIIKNKFPSVKIIIFSMSSNIHSIKKLLQVEISGYILKNKGKFELLFALRKVYEGGKYFSEEIVNLVFSNFKDHQPEIKLTEREVEVLRLISKGLTSKEIGEKLFISTNTVSIHRKNMMEKTGASNSQSLVKYGTENDLI
ncbi:MAG: response regulator transcription factor [Flavobacteriaceae bacterium]